ncbi:30S ribosomal protein S1, partial [Haemophilus influenzae]
SLQFQLLNS